MNVNFTKSTHLVIHVSFPLIKKNWTSYFLIVSFCNVWFFSVHQVLKSCQKELHKSIMSAGRSGSGDFFSLLLVCVSFLTAYQTSWVIYYQISPCRRKETHCCREKGDNIFSESISPKANKLVRLEFELAYDHVEVG